MGYVMMRDDARRGPDRQWHWSTSKGYQYALGYYHSWGAGQWEFSGRGYGVSGYWSPLGAFVGWLRFYWKGRHYRKARHARYD